MKKTTLRILAALLAVIMTLGVAPLETLTGIDFGSLFEVKASAGGDLDPGITITIDSFDINNIFGYRMADIVREDGNPYKGGYEVYHALRYGDYYADRISGKMYYIFTDEYENKRNVVKVLAEAFMKTNTHQNNYRPLNYDLTYFLNNESTAKASYLYKSNPFLTDYKNIKPQNTYLEWLKFSEYRRTDSITLECKACGHVLFRFFPHVYRQGITNRYVRLDSNASSFYGTISGKNYTLWNSLVADPSIPYHYTRIDVASSSYSSDANKIYCSALERTDNDGMPINMCPEFYLNDLTGNALDHIEYDCKGVRVQTVYEHNLTDSVDRDAFFEIAGLSFSVASPSPKLVLDILKFSNKFYTKMNEAEFSMDEYNLAKKWSLTGDEYKGQCIPKSVGKEIESGGKVVSLLGVQRYKDYFKATYVFRRDFELSKPVFAVTFDTNTGSISTQSKSFNSANIQTHESPSFKFTGLSHNQLDTSKKTTGTASLVSASNNAIASGVNSTKMKLSGTINNKGGYRVTSYGFVVGKSPTMTLKNNKCVVSSNATTKKSISGSYTTGELEQNTKYYYRMYAVAGGQYYYSDLKSFTTPKVRPKNTTLKSVNAIHYKTNKELNSNELGVGDRIKISWNPATYAEKYLLRERVRASADAPWGAWKLIGGNRTGTAATVALTEVGEHQLQICALNSAGNSDWTPALTAIVHPDVTVKFMTGNETDGYKLYQENTVTWRHALEDQLPEIPVDFGYVFVGWFRMGASALTGFQELTEDLTVYAKYKPSKYTVVFKDQTGNILKVNGKDSQIVEYGNPAIEPTDIPVKDGYQFIGWNKDIHHIVEDTEIVAVTDSLDYTRPVEVTDVSATRYSYGYVVYCTVTNTTLKDTYGRIVIAMKTDEGKLVQTTESAAYHLNGKTTNSDTGETVTDSERIKILVPTYQTEEGMSVNATADRAEVYAVENFKSMVPVSSVVSAAVIDADPYTDWCIVNDVNPGSSWAKYQQYYTDDSVEKEEKTQYRYSDYLNSKTEDEAELARLHGEHWEDNESDPPVNTGRYRYGSWSKTKPSGEYDTKTVTDSYKTVYWYKRWKYYNKGKGAWYYSYSSTWAQSMGYGGSWEYKDTTSELAYLKTVDGVKEYAGVWFRADCNGQSAHTTFKQTVADKTHTEYLPKTPIYRYSVYKWSNFTNYADTYVAEIENRRHVETRQMVRFKLEVPRVTDNSGVVREDFCVGSVGAEYAGKEAVLVIYKINEAADWTIEHIAQTVIDEDGNYFFDSYKLREEPSVMTGDYTAMLGIGGASDAIYLGTIEAPKPDLTVRYYDKVTGALISEPQTVPYGGNAEAPVPPEHDGMEFSHWDMRSTNITQDTDIYAEYTEKLYTVTFVDWQRDQLANVDAHHGDPVLSYIPPEFSAGNLSESGELQFVGWDVADEATVTENIVVTAVYEPRVLTVSYLDTVGEDSDEDGKNDIYTLNVSSTMEEAGEMAATDPVAYGDFISPPTPEVDENVLFFGWALADNPDEIVDVTATPITEDVVYTPVYCFADTAETPEISLATGSYDSAQTATITCATENALLYYTTDGSDPATSDTAILYTVPISIAETTQLRAVAMCFNMNNSAEVSALYVINDGTGANQRLLTVCFGPSNHNATYLIVEEGSTIADLIPEQEGYTFEAAYRAYDWAEVEDGEDAELVYSDPWDLQNDVVSEDVTLYLDYTPKKYTVSFVDQDGFILSEDEVPYMSEAVPPEDPSMDGYVFTGWDTEDYLTVTGDLEVHAVYVPEDEYVIVKLNHSRYYTMTGSSFALEATTEGNDEGVTLTWSSSDASVATVDEAGRVTATGHGEAEITVTVDQNGESATCVLTVMGNPAQELTLKDSSKLTVMQYQTPTDPENEEGTGESVPLLLGFTVETEGDDHHAPTVAQIKAEFKSDGLVFTAADGTPLADTDYIGTGTMIQLTENGEVLDELTAIVVGDLDGDGHVTNRDAAQILRFYKPYEDTVPVSAESLDYIQLIAMDVNADGGVNTRDVSMLLRYLVGKEKIA